MPVKKQSLNAHGIFNPRGSIRRSAYKPSFNPKGGRGEHPSRVLWHPAVSQLPRLSSTGAGLQAKRLAGLHVSVKAGTADLPEASPSLLALRVVGRRNTARQQNGRSQHPAISCASEHKAPALASDGGARDQLPIAFFFPCGFYRLLHLSHSQQEECVCRGLTHPEQGEPSPGSADRRPHTRPPTAASRHRERGIGRAQHTEDLLPKPS